MEQLGRLLLEKDFYGELLPRRQREAVELRWEGDLSLGEVAEALGISRPAVADLLRRAERTLESYEEALGLVRRRQQDEADLRQLWALCQGVPGEIGTAIAVVVRRLAERGGTDL